MGLLRAKPIHRKRWWPFPRRGWLPSVQIGGGTRFYLPSTGAAAVSPSFSAGWEDTASASRLRTITTRISSAMTTINITDLSAADRDVLGRQYVSDPLTAQDITVQYIRAQIRTSETLATNNILLAWSIFVVSNDGGTVRGTLVAVHRDDTEFDTTLTNRGDLVYGNAVSAQAGDRIVIEIGGGGAPIVTHDYSLSIGDDSGTDLAVDDSTTTANNPYIDFSQTLSFAFDELIASRLLLSMP